MSANTLNEVEKALEKEIANLRNQKIKTSKNSETEQNEIEKAVTTFQQLQRKLQYLQRSEPIQQKVANNINSILVQLSRNKNKTKVNKYLEPFIKKASLFTKRNKRINNAFPLKVQNEFTKRKGKWNAEVAPEIQRLSAEIAQVWPTIKTKGQRSKELHKILLQLQGRGHLVNTRNPEHPLNIQLTTKEKALKSYRNNKEKKKQNTIINEYKAKFNKYGYTYVPLYLGTRGEGMRASNRNYFGGIDEHFIYQTKIQTTENSPVPAGWKKVSEEKTLMNKGQFASTYYDYSLVRDLPPGYPSGPIYRAEWDSALNSLESANRT